MTLPGLDGWRTFVNASRSQGGMVGGTVQPFTHGTASFTNLLGSRCRRLASARRVPTESQRWSENDPPAATLGAGKCPVCGEFLMNLSSPAW